METLSPLEEFIHSSHELKQQILRQALTENAQLREKVADLHAEVAARDALIDLAAQRLEHMAKLVATLMADHTATAQ